MIKKLPSVLAFVSHIAYSPRTFSSPKTRPMPLGRQYKIRGGQRETTDLKNPKQDSQSIRILWLLEELRLAYPDFSYDLKKYTRITHGERRGRAPPELKKTHPLGKSPQLTTADGLTINESSAIATYLLLMYDRDHLFSNRAPTLSGDKDAILATVHDETLSSFANASISPVMGIWLTLDILVSQMPFFLRWLQSAIRTQAVKMFLGPEIETMFKYLDSELADGREFFSGLASHPAPASTTSPTSTSNSVTASPTGGRPGRCDFMLSWVVEFCVEKIRRLTTRRAVFARPPMVREVSDSGRMEERQRERWS